MGSKTTFESLNAKFAHQLMRQEPGWRWRDPLANYVRTPRPCPLWSLALPMKKVAV